MFHFLRYNTLTRKSGRKLPSIDYRQLSFDLNGYYLQLQKEHRKQVQLEGKKRKLTFSWGKTSEGMSGRGGAGLTAIQSAYIEKIGFFGPTVKLDPNIGKSSVLNH